MRLSPALAAAFLAGSLAASATLAAKTTVAPGFRFRASTHSEGTASGAISMADVDVVGQVEGEKARVEIEKSRNPLLPNGTVLLSTDGGKTFSLLDPARKTSSSWAPPDRAQGNRAGASIVRVRFENPEVEKLAERPGGKVARQATKYFKFRISYVSEVDVMGTVQKTATERIEELWTAPALAAGGFAAWLRKDSSLTGNEAFDRRIAAELSRAPGPPLKRVTTTSWKDASGKVQTVTTTLSVSELKKVPAAPDLFKIPPGFHDDSAGKH